MAKQQEVINCFCHHVLERRINSADSLRQPRLAQMTVTEVMIGKAPQDNHLLHQL